MIEPVGSRNIDLKSVVAFPALSKAQSNHSFILDDSARRLVMRLQKLSPSVATVKLLPVIGELILTVVLRAHSSSKRESLNEKAHPLSRVGCVSYGLVWLGGNLNTLNRSWGARAQRRQESIETHDSALGGDQILLRLVQLLGQDVDVLLKLLNVAQNKLPLSVDL